MTLAESIVSDAIRYSMRKFCFANIVIAGPICAGKKRVAQLISTCSDVCSIEPNVTVFAQDNYYKEYDELFDTPFGVKNIDTKSAFETKRFLSDVRTFYEEGNVVVSAYSRKKWSRNWNVDFGEETKTACILESKKVRRINIFVGTHVINLLKPSLYVKSDLQDKFLGGSSIIPYNIPEAIYIYLNTNHEICMMRREQSGIMYPNSLLDIKVYREYSNFIENIVNEEIAIQKDIADIVINCN